MILRLASAFFAGYSAEGMPIGMSLIGRAFDEKTIIAVCDRFERDHERRECVL